MYKIYFLILLAAFLFGLMSPAQAQMATQPWAFQPQNRASIAALMRQVESPSPVATTTVTNMVCGSDGESSARGNSTCVILHNALGDIDVGQESNGDQTADADSSNNQQQSQSQAQQSTAQANHTSADDVLSTLQGTAN
jgi:hypothetical protein